MLERLGNLKRIPRTGWLFAGVSPKDVEDVAQHSFEVAVITLLLSEEFERSGKKIDRERVLSMAISHDWAEVLTADFPNTALKYLDSPEIKGKMEMKALADLVGDEEVYLKLQREYNEKKTTESKLVHTADYLSMLLQALKYREQGNLSGGLEELWNAVVEDLKPYAEEFPAVKKLIEGLGNRYPTID